jgi:Tol biopolymer transport system component
MLLTRLQWTVGLVLAAVFGLGASLFVVSGAIAGEKPRGTARTAEDRPKPPGEATDKTKTGRLYYHLSGELAAIRPDGTKGTNLGKVADADLWGGYQPYTARLSPDGKRLAFGKAVEKQTEQGRGVYPPDKIYLRDAARSERGELLAEKAGSEIHNWTWAPDGSKLAFVTWDAPGVLRNWIVEVKTKKVREVKLPRYKTRDGKEQTLTIEAWSPDGASFLAAGDGLHLVKADGSTARRLMPGDRPTMGGSGRFSPDGRRVLFVRCDPDDCQTLHVVDVASGKSRPVVEAKNFTDMQACWSPDGRRIAYCVTLLDDKGKRSGETSLFVTNVAGKQTTTVLTEKHQPGEVRLVLTDWR